MQVSIAMAGKGGGGIKLDEEAINEILVADTGSESDYAASYFEDYFEEEEEEDQQQQASAEIETQAATNGGLPNWGPPQGRNTNIHLSFQQKV